MSNIAMQLEETANGSVLPSSNVLFDSISYSSGNISYSSASGEITIAVSGRYIVNWWVAVQSSSSETGVLFALFSSQGNFINGNSPLKTGEINGFGIIDVSSAPVTLSLINSSAKEYFYPENISKKASLMIVQDDFVNETTILSSYGGIYSEVSQAITLPAGGGELQIQFEETMPSLNVTYGDNSITVQNSGVYEINYLLVVATSPSSNGLSASIRANGIPISQTYVGLVLSSAAFNIFSASTLYELNAGDELTLYVDSLVEINTILGPRLTAYITVKQIS